MQFRSEDSIVVLGSWKAVFNVRNRIGRRHLFRRPSDIIELNKFRPDEDKDERMQLWMGITR